MARGPIRKLARPATALSRGAKISNYQFKKVLWRFTLDDPVAEATRHVRLSANSIDAIYTKLRRFFFRWACSPTSMRARTRVRAAPTMRCSNSGCSSFTWAE